MIIAVSTEKKEVKREGKEKKKKETTTKYVLIYWNWVLFPKTLNNAYGSDFKMI